MTEDDQLTALHYPMDAEFARCCSTSAKEHPSPEKYE